MVSILRVVSGAQGGGERWALLGTAKRGATVEATAMSSSTSSPAPSPKRWPNPHPSRPPACSTALGERRRRVLSLRLSQEGGRLRRDSLANLEARFEARIPTTQLLYYGQGVRPTPPAPSTRAAHRQQRTPGALPSLWKPPSRRSVEDMHTEQSKPPPRILSAPPCPRNTPQAQAGTTEADIYCLQPASG